MYARTVNGRTLIFGVSGLLLNANLVMYDTETYSHWSHFTGEALDGEFKGERLEIVPSNLTSWQAWRAQHPETTVIALERSADSYATGFYQEPERFVLGIAHAGQARAYPFDRLAAERVITDRLGEEEVVVIFEPASTGARIFRRAVRGHVLTFEPAAAGRMTDEETGSLWSTEMGLCLEGPLHGEALEPLPTIVAFRKSWLDFHPESSVFGEEPSLPVSAQP